MKSETGEKLGNKVSHGEGGDRKREPTKVTSLARLRGQEKEGFFHYENCLLILLSTSYMYIIYSDYFSDALSSLPCLLHAPLLLL